MRGFAGGCHMHLEGGRRRAGGRAGILCLVQLNRRPTVHGLITRLRGPSGGATRLRDRGGPSRRAYGRLVRCGGDQVRSKSEHQPRSGITCASFARLAQEPHILHDIARCREYEGHEPPRDANSVPQPRQLGRRRRSKSRPPTRATQRGRGQ